MNTALQRASQNPALAEHPKLSEDLGIIRKKTEEYIATKQKSVSADGQAGSADETGKGVDELLSVLVLNVEQEVNSATEKHTSETEKQEGLYRQTGLASEVLVNASEIVTLGLSVEEQATRLFTGLTPTETEKVA